MFSEINESISGACDGNYWLEYPASSKCLGKHIIKVDEYRIFLFRNLFVYWETLNIDFILVRFLVIQNYS